MDRTEIRNFAIYARNKLIEDIKTSLLQIGVTKKGLTSYDGHLNHNQRKTRSIFDSLIKSQGGEYSSAYDTTVEDVAYNWFTRIVALRYMDLNNIIPVENSIFPNNKGEEPTLLAVKDFSILNFTEEEKEVSENYRKKGDDDLFYTFIFVKLSNYVSKILGIFPDDMEGCNIPLFVLSYKNDGLITRLCSIDESNFTNGVEIMGWFHQYYNTDVFNRLYDGDMSKKKIESKYLPVATQLYTPDWVVKYMVENTLGRTWIDHLLGLGKREKAKILLENWVYYIPDTDEDSVELFEIRQKKRDITPQSITFIDPCMGSGHILVYAFEILMQIYMSEGYSKEDAPLIILKNNLFGLDIDDRACYLSRFALMMKAYQYDSNILSKTNGVNLFAVQESNSFTYLRETRDFFAQGNDRLIEEFEYLVSVFYNAKEYGSLLNLRKVDFKALDKRISEIYALTTNKEQEELYKKEIIEKFVPLVNQAKVMTNYYDVVVTNPPYLNSSRMSKNLADYVNREYSIAKNDLASVFIQKATGVLTKDDGMVAMITTVSWMYLKSFEKFRKYLLHTFQINSIVDFGTELFEGKIGHLPVVTWTSRKHLPFQKIHSVRLAEYNYSKRSEKQQQFFNRENHFYAHQMDFAKIPGEPVAYWLGDSFIKAFEQGRTLGELSVVRNGMKTGDNKRFLRLWWEVDGDSVNYTAKSATDALNSGCRYFPYNKGGEYRKWYGNNDYLVDWHNNGEVVMGMAKSDGRHTQDYNEELKFLPLITWSLITVKPAFRFKENALSDIAGMSIYTGEDKLYYYLGFCNSVIATEMIKLLAPTMNCQVGDIARLPILHSRSMEEEVNTLVKENIRLSKEDWDSFEKSWDFKTHPFIMYKSEGEDKIQNAFEKWEEIAQNRFEKLKANEERLNRIFLDIYEVTRGFDPSVDDKDITVSRADKVRDVKSFISFGVGCILGRYSLNKDGVVYSGSDWDIRNYGDFPPVDDGVVLVSDNEDAKDDLVYHFSNFVKYSFGEKYFEENWLYIASALEEKGKTPTEKIRNYFFSTFYKEHLSRYKVGVSGKRPIYWMFNSGGKKSFKALVYMHRWNYTTVENIRKNLLSKEIKHYKDKITELEDNISLDNKDEYSVMMKLRDDLLSRYEEIQSFDKSLAKLEGNTFDLNDGIIHNHQRIQTTADGEVLKILEKI